MKLEWCDNHEHLINKSFAKAKQCMWLLQMGSTLNHELALNSLYSHDLNLGGDHHPPPYNILYDWRVDYIKMV
jgi:hypothetical protein